MSVRDCGHDVSSEAVLQDSPSGPLVMKRIQQVPDVGVGDAQPQVVAGDVFDRVGLVEDQEIVVRQNGRTLRAHREIGKQERVVDDE